jgi:RNA polymerase sigma factor (TIGR02999 family)
MSEVTNILERLEQGDPRAAEDLMPLVYEELRRLAEAKMSREAAGHTLQPTALVHEAWLRLSGGDGPRFANRCHFFGAAAEAMRRILVDAARRKSRDKRGGQWTRVDLDEVQLAVDSDPAVTLGIDEALTRLAAGHPEKAELVKLRFFAGLSLPEAAQALDLSLTTAKRHWAFARAWLYGELTGDTGD